MASFFEEFTAATFWFLHVGANTLQPRHAMLALLGYWPRLAVPIAILAPDLAFPVAHLVQM